MQTGQQQRADVKLKYELTGHDQFCQLRWCNQLKLNPALGCIAGECGFNEERM